MPNEIDNLKEHLAQSETLSRLLSASDIYRYRLPKGWAGMMPLALIERDRFTARPHGVRNAEFAICLFVPLEDDDWEDAAPVESKIAWMDDFAADIAKELVSLADTHTAGVMAIDEAAHEGVVWPTPPEAVKHGKFLRCDLSVSWGWG